MNLRCLLLGHTPHWNSHHWNGRWTRLAHCTRCQRLIGGRP